jgi:hypothetical protein
LWHVLEPALSHQKQVTAPATQQGWDWLQKQVDARTAPPVGTGVVQPANALAGGVQAIPLEPPPWATQRLSSEGTSPPQGAKLKTARAAEAIAMQALRSRVESLPLGNSAVGQAAKHDPRLERALVRALDRARPYEVDYHADDSVTVYMTMSGSDLWGMLFVR